MSSLTSRGYTATQYALLSSAYTYVGKFAKGFSGVTVEWLATGRPLLEAYALFFIGAGLLGCLRSSSASCSRAKRANHRTRRRTRDNFLEVSFLDDAVVRSPGVRDRHVARRAAVAVRRREPVRSGAPVPHASPPSIS
jgi:hypothetical protein